MGDESQYAYCGVVEVVDNSARQSTGTTNYEMTNRTNNYDKQSGSYTRGTAKESYSSGDYSNRGRVGYKNEYKASSTVRVGDNSGYTEYQKQEKVTRVDYDTSSYSGGSSKSYGGGSKGYKSYGGGNKYLN